MRLELIEGLSENRGKTTIWPHVEKQAEKPKNKKHLIKKLFHCKIIICETQAIDSRTKEKFKHERAQGECLGIRSRRRT